MRIVLDLQAVQTESRFRGIGRYSLELAKAIVKNAVNHEIWILLSEQLVNVMPDIVIAFEGTLPKNRIILLSVPNEISWESANNQWRREAAQIIRDDFLNQIAPDIVHVASLFEGADKCAATSSIGHPQNRFRTAVTLYDLIPLLNPEQYLGAQWVRDWYMDKVESLKRADLLLAISEYARQEAMEHLSLNGDTVINIGASHTSNFHPTNLTDLARKVLLSRYAITKLFFELMMCFKSL